LYTIKLFQIAIQSLPCHEQKYFKTGSNDDSSFNAEMISPIHGQIENKSKYKILIVWNSFRKQLSSC